MTLGRQAVTDFERSESVLEHTPALANKMARIASALMNLGETFRSSVMAA